MKQLRDEAPVDALQDAVEQQHGGTATFDRVIYVVERYEGQPTWVGPVHIFKLTGQTTATECYAWSDPVPDSDRRRFYAVLRAGPVTSPKEAVRAAIVHEYSGSGRPE